MFYGPAVVIVAGYLGLLLSTRDLRLSFMACSCVVLTYVWCLGIFYLLDHNIGVRIK